MKICIFGAGAIGGYLAVLLAQSGQQVSVIARGPHLTAIQKHGFRLRIDGEERVAHIDASDDPTDFEPQDYLIVGLKTHSLRANVEPMQALLGPNTAVVTASNGVPWWYFYALTGKWENRILQSVDPGGEQWLGIGPQRAIGCVVYPACTIAEPGVVQHVLGSRFTLGEPNGEKTDRVRALSAALIAAGFKAPIRRIRDEIWLKLIGNLSFNPISVLTGATLDIIATESPGSRDVARAMMLEAQTIGEKLGARFAIDVDKRLDGAAAVGAHRTSMLQDLDSGRPMEIDAIVGAVQEMGIMVKVPTPTIDVVLALVRQRERIAHGLISA